MLLGKDRIVVGKVGRCSSESEFNWEKVWFRQSSREIMLLGAPGFWQKFGKGKGKVGKLGNGV